MALGRVPRTRQTRDFLSVCGSETNRISPDHEFHFRGLGGILLAERGLASGVLVGDVVYLLLIAAVPIGVCLRRPRPRTTGLRRVFMFPLRLDFALVELFGSGVFFK
jgi:hypothetical protein